MDRGFDHYTIGDGVDQFEIICSKFVELQKKNPRVTQRNLVNQFVTRLSLKGEVCSYGECWGHSLGLLKALNLPGQCPGLQ